MEETLLLVVAAPPAYPTIRESWAAVGWWLLVSLVLGVPLLLAIRHWVPTTGVAEVWVKFMVSELITLGTIWWLWRRAGAARWPGLRWAELAVRGSWLGVLPPLVVGMLLLLSTITLLHLPDWSGQRYQELGKHLKSALFLGGIVAPAVEEVFFRGILLKGLLRNYRPWVAIGQSALLFGLVHFNPGQSLAVGLMGLVLGWLYYRTRSLGLCIGYHALNNLLAFTEMHQHRVQAATSVVQYFGAVRYGLLLASAAVVVAACLWWIGQGPPPAGISLPAGPVSLSATPRASE